MNTLSGRAIALAFVAGVLATLVFHQLYILAMGGNAYSFAPTRPFGIWTFVSLSFFGGLWGIVLAFIVPRLPSPFNEWLGWLILGAVLPTLVLWFIVLPLRGASPSRLWTPWLLFLIPTAHAVWGIATWGIIKAGDMVLGRARTA